MTVIFLPSESRKTWGEEKLFSRKNCLSPVRIKKIKACIKPDDFQKQFYFNIQQDSLCEKVKGVKNSTRQLKSLYRFLKKFCHLNLAAHWKTHWKLFQETMQVIICLTLFCRFFIIDFLLKLFSSILSHLSEMTLRFFQISRWFWYKINKQFRVQCHGNFSLILLKCLIIDSDNLVQLIVINFPFQESASFKFFSI